MEWLITHVGSFVGSQPWFVNASKWLAQPTDVHVISQLLTSVLIIVGAVLLVSFLIKK